MINNKLFYERLSQAIQQSGKSANQIERELGYPRNSLHNYKLGSEPSASRLIELANYFRLSPVYLLGKLSGTIANNSKEYFEHLTEKQKFELLRIAQEWEYDVLFKKYTD